MGASSGLMYVALLAYSWRIKVLNDCLRLHIWFCAIVSPAWNSWWRPCWWEWKRLILWKKKQDSRNNTVHCFMIAGFTCSISSHQHLLRFLFIFFLPGFPVLSFTFLRWNMSLFWAGWEKWVSFLDFIRRRWQQFRHFRDLYYDHESCIYIAAPFLRIHALWSQAWIHGVYNPYRNKPGCQYLMMPIWGKASDKFGAIKVLSVTSFLVPCVAVLWVSITASGTFLWSGVFWLCLAGYEYRV